MWKPHVHRPLVPHSCWMLHTHVHARADTHPHTHIYALALIYTQMQKYIQEQSTPIYHLWCNCVWHAVKTCHVHCRLFFKFIHFFISFFISSQVWRHLLLGLYQTNIDSYFGWYSCDILINIHPSWPSSPRLFTFLSFSNSFFMSISY